MIKVCVVTVFKHNYGAFLQAYASQRFLESLGYEAEVLDYDYLNDHALLGVSLKKIRQPITFAKMVLYRMLRYRVTHKRDVIMEESAKKLIKQTRLYKTYADVKKDPPKSDIFIVGSDQVWNPAVSEQGFLSRLLDFVPAEWVCVRSSYAASVGTDHFSETEAHLFKKNLACFDCISVREESSIPLMKTVTNHEIVVHKDPSLLLNVEQWNHFAQNPYPGKKYLFIYLAQKAPELVEYAKKLAKETNLEIVDCHANVNYEIPNTLNGRRVLNPMEFVGAIKNAKYVVTNSFHCLVFSIHYQKKVRVSLPPHRALRLSELIEKMNLHRLLEEKYIQDQETAKIYQNTKDYLEKERALAKSYFMELACILNEKQEKKATTKSHLKNRGVINSVENALG